MKYFKMGYVWNSQGFCEGFRSELFEHSHATHYAKFLLELGETQLASHIVRHEIASLNVRQPASYMRFLHPLSISRMDAEFPLWMKSQGQIQSILTISDLQVSLGDHQGRLQYAHTLFPEWHFPLLMLATLDEVAFCHKNAYLFAAKRLARDGEAVEIVNKFLKAFKLDVRSEK